MGYTQRRARVEANWATHLNPLKPTDSGAGLAPRPAGGKFRAGAGVPERYGGREGAARRGDPARW